MMALGIVSIVQLALVLLLAWNALAIDPYKVLGISKTASDKEIKKAYRTLSKKYHPDKNPDDKTAEQQFVEVSQAYEILSDKEKREIFDKYGEEGLKRQQQGGGGGFHDPFSVFSQFFGGGGGFSQQQQQRRGPNMVSEVQVDLEDIYIGKTFDFDIQKQAICESCEGSGARSAKDVVDCQTCGGRGIRQIRQMLGPGIYQTMQMHCDQCGGRGKVIAHACPTCKGQRIVHTKSKLSLDIDRGLPENSEIVFENEADESPDWVAGDVILRVKSRKREGGFVRKESNLYWRETIGLVDALLGFERNITHLDGHYLTLRREGVTQPSFVQVVHGEGMPLHHSTGSGDLFVEYNVVLPNEISPSLRSRLESAFGVVSDDKSRTAAKGKEEL